MTLKTDFFVNVKDCYKVLNLYFARSLFLLSPCSIQPISLNEWLSTFFILQHTLPTIFFVWHTYTHRCTQGGWGGGIKVYPPSKIFAKLVNKNAIKHQKGVPSLQNFYNPYIPSLPKFGKNLIDPPPRISNPVHLCLNPPKYFGAPQL